jgi:predicted O-methyltransferase YrrM
MVFAMSKFVNILRPLKRLKYALHYFSPQLIELFRWSIRRTEDHNYYYELEEDNYLYLCHFLSTTFGTPVREVESYLNEILSDHEIRDILASNFKNDPRLKDSSPYIGRRVGWYIIVRIMKPKLVFESGVFQGLGSLVICKALSFNKIEGYTGTYLGTDIDPSSGVFFKGDLAIYGQILFDDTVSAVNALDTDIDLYICDSDHSATYELKEYQAAKSKMSEDGIIISDNAHATNVLAKWSEVNNKNFFFFKEVPKNHWYPGGGIGISK